MPSILAIIPARYASTRFPGKPLIDLGGKVVMTGNHSSGTDRCFDALQQQQKKYEYVINVQGDEPFIQPAQIDLLAAALDGTTEIATLAKKITDTETIFNANVVKVVFNQHGKALYFSRSPIPHVRNKPESEWLQSTPFYKHIGMYAYRSDVLQKITSLPVSLLEQAESLEQLRWLEHGYSISVFETEIENLGIDTPEDVQRALTWLQSR